MVKKKKKIEQKVDLQEPQENINDSNKDNEEKPEEIEREDSEIVEGMIYCKSCKKDIEPYPVDHGRWRCPDCNKYTRSPDMKGKDVENLKEVKPSKERQYEILSSRNIKFSGNELAQAEMLIQSGVATNFNDLAKKAFNILFLKEKVNKAFGVDINKMEINNEPNPERTMKQIQEQEMMKAYIEGMKKGNQTDPMATMMMLRMMENQGKGKESGSNGMMDKMLEIQMLKTVMGGQNSDASNLQSQIAELKHGMQMQQLLSQQQQQQQGNNSSQEFMQQMEKIRADRDQAIKKAEVDAQNERDKNLQLAFENRKSELENRLKSLEEEKQKSSGTLSTQRIKYMKEEINAIKDMSKVLGDKEKGAGEMVMESLGNVAEKALPSLIELGKQRQQQQMMHQQIPPPSEQLPQELPPQQPNPEQPNPLGLTPTEKQMSDQYSDMYLNSTKKNE